MEKLDNEIFMLLSGSLYLVLQGELLSRATTNVKERIRSTIQSKKRKVT